MIADLFESYLGFEPPANTRRTYENVIKEWIEFCTANHYDPVHATDKHSAHFITWMFDTKIKSKKNSKATLKSKVQFLFHFWTYLKSRAVVEQNIWAESYIRFKRVRGGDIRQYRALSDEDVKTLMIVCDSQQRAIMALFFACGLRRSEVVKINLEDIVRAKNGAELVLKGTKSGRPQKQPIPYWASERVDIHVKSRIADGAGPSDPLFISGWKRRMSVETLGRMFKYIAEGAGIANVSTHCGRVTAATKLRENGGDLRDVQAFLRHSSLGMAQRYIRNDDAEKSRELVKY